MITEPTFASSEPASPTAASTDAGAPAKLSGPQIAQRAKRQLSQLTGLKPETVSRLERDGEGWKVRLEMIELKRIPEGNDVLGTYQVTTDADGNVMSYERIRRYVRGQVGDEE